ncbi:MAG: hypothetical protein ACNFW9_01745 [Candidatus Kerfeldbacteria bacterium]
MKKYKQQQVKDLEKYINLECDLEINKNILPAITTLEKYEFNNKLSIYDLYKIVCKKQFNINITKDIDLTKCAIIKTSAHISYTSDKLKKEWEKHDKHDYFTNYSDKLLNDEKFPPIVLTHSNVLKKYINKNILKINFSFKGIIYFFFNIFHKIFKSNSNLNSNKLFQIDGMHRIMSALKANQKTFESYIIVDRNDIANLLKDDEKINITKTADKCTWFPRYQEIREAGLNGERKQDSRYSKIYNFSNLKNKSVIDFGGNIGQAAVEAFFNGATKIISFDIQKEAIDTGKIISDTLGLDIIHDTIDFNKESFENDVQNLAESWDWTIFQAIYRTKEIRDIKKNFDFIVNNTKEGIIFEGNADPRIDTNEYYQEIFKPYNFSSIKFLGHHQKRPAFIIIK